MRRCGGQSFVNRDQCRKPAHRHLVRASPGAAAHGLRGLAAWAVLRWPPGGATRGRHAGCFAPARAAARCTRCPRVSLVQTRWGVFAYSRCRGRARGRLPPCPLAWAREYHVMASAGVRAVRCLRCGRSTARPRLTDWEHRVCVARRLLVGGAPPPLWGGLYCTLSTFNRQEVSWCTCQRLGRLRCACR